MSLNSYPPGPSSFPEGFTIASKKYKQKALVASVTLLLFILSYLGLTTWLFYTSLRLFSNTFTGGIDAGYTFFVGLLLAFLGVFLAKALFFFTKSERQHSYEITKEQEPQLFDFINKVADDAKAPRPHKVFLSNTVNAFVFYDLSIINLFFPSKKNLEIGLGLVNILNLGEFKSILAHEFGHFNQRSMLVGRWVYISHQVAVQIISKRDALDNFINSISRVDIRIAWIGWFLSFIIWSIRSVMEFLFRIVVITERALSREMEFHADLVSVSLTGSDALVHSLHKLNAADAAFANSLQFINKQLVKNKRVLDFYALQSNSVKHMALIINDPRYGVSPKPPMGDGSKHSVFKENVTPAPKMWASHPPNYDREANAKKIYIKALIDERSPWILFNDADALKRKFSAELYKDIVAPAEFLSVEESIHEQNQDLGRSSLQPRYRGAYLDRSIFHLYKNFEDVYDQGNFFADVNEQFKRLYPESLKDELEKLRTLEEEINILEGYENKTIVPDGGVIKFRGNEVSRKHLSEFINKVKQEAKKVRGQIHEHDRLCRNVHYVAAKKIGNGWDDYTYSMVSLIHYCEHLKSNVESSSRVYRETLFVAMQISNISVYELGELIREANRLHTALEEVYTSSNQLKLNEGLSLKLDGRSFSEILGEFKLGPAYDNNINSWVSVVESWTTLVIESIETLHRAALDELLAAEEQIELMSLGRKEQIMSAPVPVMVPQTYTRHDPVIRKTSLKVNDIYSKFQSSEGLAPYLRLAIAACIIFAGIILTGSLGSSNLFIFNGLPVDVIVNLPEQTITVPAGQSVEIILENDEKLPIKTTALNGDPVESFTATPEESRSRTYIYNVASAAILYQTAVFYGRPASEGYEKMFGARRWMTSKVDHYFTNAPKSISLKEGRSEVRTVLASLSDGSPEQMMSVVTDSTEMESIVTAHATWEDKNSLSLLSWLNYASAYKNFNEIIAKRLKRDPFEVASLRMLQETADPVKKIKICEQQKELSIKHPENADLYYLACRCILNESEKDSAFAKGNERWPDNAWLAFATGYGAAQNNNWSKALACFNTAYKNEPILREAVATDMQRIYYFLKAGDSSLVQDQIESPYLSYVNLIENSSTDVAENHYYAYKLISQGKLKEAIEFSQPDTNLSANILRMAAISKGASKEMIQNALALPLEKGLNGATMAPALALAIKNNVGLKDKRQIVDHIMQGYGDTIIQFTDHIQNNRVKDAEKMLLRMNLEIKAKISLLGTLVLEEKVPANWKLMADRLLFINEKPYLGMKRK